MRLLSFGEILFDIFPDGAHLGGAPLNLAAHSSLQGTNAYMLSAVGDDALGKSAIAQIDAFKIKTDYIAVMSERETGKCLVTLDGHAVPSYNLLSDVAYDYIPFPEFKERFEVFCFGTLALRTDYNLQTVKRVIYSGVADSIYCDLNIRAPHSSEKAILFCLESANFVKISDEELPTVTMAAFGKEMGAGEAVRAISEKYKQIKLIIITLGGEGSCVYDCASGELLKTAAVPAEVVSTVGAGDSFGATFIASYFSGDSLENCLKKASAVSSFVVSKNGAVPEEIEEFIENLKTAL